MLDVQRDIRKMLCYEIKPSIINKLIGQQMQLKSKETETNIFYLPKNYGQQVDATRQPLAFGDWAIPQLKKQLKVNDVCELLKILNSIHDLAHDPEKGVDIVRYGVAADLLNFLSHTEVFVKEKVCSIFYALALQNRGRDFLMKNYKALSYFSRLLEDENEELKIKSGMIIEMISRSYLGAVLLNEADYLVLLLRLVDSSSNDEPKERVLLYLGTLNMLLQKDVKQSAIRNNAFEIFLVKMYYPDDEVTSSALSCLTLLLWTKEGKRISDEIQLLKHLRRKIYDESDNVQSKAVAAMAFATHTPSGKELAVNLNVICRILDLLDDDCSFFKEKKLMCVKLLTNLCGNPDGRKCVKKKKVQERIKKIDNCGDETLSRHVEILLYV